MGSRAKFRWQWQSLELQRLEDRLAPAGVNTLVSRAEPTLYGDSAGGMSYVQIDPSAMSAIGQNVSADGRFVAFQSKATNVVAGQVDTNNAYDVFLYDRVAHTTVLVSGANGSPMVTANGQDAHIIEGETANAAAQAISADGRYVTFASNATNIVSGFVPAAGPPTNIYVYDRLTAQCKLVSHAAGSLTASASAICTIPNISGNGQVITFATKAANLVAGFPNPGGGATSQFTHAYAYDLPTGQVTLIDHKYGSVTDPGTGNGEAYGITPDGRYIMLNSFASDMLSVTSASKGDVYRYDRQTGVNQLVSRGSNIAPFGGNARAHGAAISADGKWISMNTGATNLVPGATSSGIQVLLCEVDTGQIRLVSHVPGNSLVAGNSTSTFSVMSANGKYVSFVSRASNLVTGFVDGNSTSTYDSFLYDRDTDQITLVNHQAGSLTKSANASCTMSTISADGAYLVFSDSSTDLVAGFTDRNGASSYDVYRYEQATGAVSLISGQNNSATLGGNGRTGNWAMSADGNVVAMASEATDLSSSIVDVNGYADIYLKDLTDGSTTLASSAGMPSKSAGGAAESANQTPDGRYVVFVDTAANLVPGQVSGGPYSNVFLFDRATNTTTLVSHAAGSTTTSSNGENSSPVVSADGRFVAYSSVATNLVPGFVDGNGTLTPVNDGTDVYLFDLITGQNVLVSHQAGSTTAGGNYTSGGIERRSLGWYLNISDDGRWIVFQSDATDLIAGGIGANGADQVYLYDRMTATVSLISHIPGSPGTAVNSTNFPRSMSADGRFIAYFSNASNIVTGMTGGGGRNVILYDRLADTNVLVSHDAGSMTASSDAGSNNPYISRDGNYITYQSAATNLIAGGVDGNSQNDVFLYDRATGTNTLVSHAFHTNTQAGNLTSFEPVISADGRYVTYSSEAQDLISGFVDGNVNTPPSDGRDVWLYDRVTNTNTLVSRTAASAVTGGNGTSLGPSISGDGRFVGYVSSATDLVSGFTLSSPYNSNIYLYDRVLGTNVLVSHDVNSATVAGNRYPGFLTINQDGSVVVYRSEASNLVAGDLNDFIDVFAYVQGPPTVLSVQVNDGSAQRSLVKSVVVTFSEPVTFTGPVASAFTVRRTGSGGTVGDVTLSASPSSGPTSSVTITFSGSLTESGGSLVDGLYDLWINPAQVSGTFGLLDGNNDGVAGGSYHLVGTTANGFYRLFGDSNGDATVSRVDHNALFLVYLTGPSSIFDFNNDGEVSQLDYNAFILRFLGAP